MRFAYPHVLILELLVPLLALFYFLVFRKRRRTLAALGDQALIERLSSSSSGLQLLKAGLTVAAVFFLLLALARPQFGTKLVEAKQQGADIVIAVDVSSSMLAQDLKPDRLAKAKESLGALVQQLGGNRIGIIAFAGTAFWQCPLTLDTSAANLFLQIMDANIIPLPGTAIGDALRLGIKGLEKTAPGSKAIVLLTDGEDHKSDPLAAAGLAAKSGIKVYTIGFGNPAGEPIPLTGAQGQFTGYKKDKKGDVVMSKMDEGLLAKISAETGGEYIRATDGAIDTVRLVDSLQGLGKRKLTSQLNRQYEDRYQYFLFLGVLLLLVDYLLLPVKRKATTDKSS
jgi:Ca-activated chloride channel family protein